MKIFDVTNAVVDENKVVLALFDLRYNSVMVIKPKGDKLEILEPDGAERLYWLEKFGMITEEDFQTEVKQLTPQTERQNLYELLKREFEQGGK